LVLWGALVGRATAWRAEGVLPQADEFAQYAGKFCFDYAPWIKVVDEAGHTHEERQTAGYYDLTVRGGVQARPLCDKTGRCHGEGRLFMMTFDDEKIHWKRARYEWSELTCNELLRDASGVVDVTSHLDKAETFTTHIRIVEHLRPRFWHFLFLNCGARVITPLSYELHAWNLHQGRKTEFGADQSESLAIEVVFGFLFSLLAAASLVVTWGRGFGRKAVKGRPLIHLLQCSALLSAVGCLSITFHHGVYAFDGRGVAAADIFSTLCAALSRAVLMVLQLLVARGWALFAASHEVQHRKATLIALAVIVILAIGCEIHNEYFVDQSTRFYLYQSWPGLLILTLNIFLLVLAWSSLWEAHSREPSEEVRSFYRGIGGACGIYFATLPLVCLLAERLHPWWRWKVVEGVEMGTRCAATALLLLCLRPSRLDIIVAARLDGGSVGGGQRGTEATETTEEGEALTAAAESETGIVE